MKKPEITTKPNGTWITFIIKSHTTNQPMKILFTTLFLTLCSAVIGQTGSYIPINPDHVWRIDQINNAPVITWHCYGEYHYQLYIDGDTLIQGQQGQKVYRSEHVTSTSSGNEDCFPYFYSQAGYAGSIFDDTIANEVYFILPSDTNRLLLYDYNLNVGDSLISDMVYCDRVITDIDTVQIDGIDRRRWHYTGCTSAMLPATDEYYIEGIGSSHGLIEPIGLGLMRSKLICVQKNGTNIFDTGISSLYGCQLAMAGLNPQEEIQPEITIYPNPANEIIHIQHDQASIESIRIINELGQTQTIDPLIKADEVEINIDGLASGIYIVHMQFQNTVVSKSIVVR